MFGNPKHYYVWHMQKSQIYATFLRDCETPPPAPPGHQCCGSHAVSDIWGRMFSLFILQGVLLPSTCTNTNTTLNINRRAQNQWSQTVNNTRRKKKKNVRQPSPQAMHGFNTACGVMEAGEMWGSAAERAEGLGRLVIRWRMDRDSEEEVISEPSLSLIWPVTQDHSWTRLPWTNTHAHADTPYFPSYPPNTHLLSFFQLTTKPHC